MNSISDNSRNLCGRESREERKKKRKIVDFSVDPSKWTHAQLSYFYKLFNPICLSASLPVTYRHTGYDNRMDSGGMHYKGEYSGPRIDYSLCDKWHCARCRKKRAYRLKRKIEKAIVQHKLHNHIVITTEGNEKYRNEKNYVISYVDMMEAWNKLRWVLRYYAYKKGLDLSYVLLNRAQKNGYSHLHILCNLEIPKDLLRKMVKKYKVMGFVEVKQHKNTSGYLANDFIKDHEWYIPLNTRHYTCSRDIDLSIDTWEEKLEEKGVEYGVKIRLDPSKGNIVDQIYDQTNILFGYPPPLEAMLREWIKSRDGRESVFKASMPYSCNWVGAGGGAAWYGCTTPPKPL